MTRLPLKLGLLASLAFALSGSACSTYHYFDLDLQLDTAFNTSRIGQIESCHMFVTGAVTDNFELDDAVRAPCRGTNPATRDIGHVEYSTFEDSGNVTFTLRVFQNPESNPLCEIGNGSTTLAIGSRVTGTLTVQNLSGGGCK